MDSGAEPLEVQPLGIAVWDGTGNLEERAGVRGAAVVFPPAVMAVAMLASQRDHAESCDLIIAVDGTRVRNTVDLVDALQDIRTGDAVYLTIVRQGQRKQVVVHVR